MAELTSEWRFAVHAAVAAVAAICGLLLSPNKPMTLRLFLGTLLFGPLAACFSFPLAELTFYPLSLFTPEARAIAWAGSIGGGYVKIPDLIDRIKGAIRDATDDKTKNG